jgi:hypothetical protein
MGEMFRPNEVSSTEAPKMYEMIVKGHTYRVSEEIHDHIDDMIERYIESQENDKALDAISSDNTETSISGAEVPEETDGKYEDSLLRI